MLVHRKDEWSDVRQPEPRRGDHVGLTASDTGARELTVRLAVAAYPYRDCSRSKGLGIYEGLWPSSLPK